MNGTFAVFGSEVYFSDTLIKVNLEPVRYPLENWMQDQGNIFVPLCRDSIGTSSLADKLLEKPYHQNSFFPKICGISFNSNRVMLELGTENGSFVWRKVPWGPGVIYVSSSNSVYEQILYSSLLITQDLRKAVDLASKSSMSLSVNPIFTTVSIASYATYMKDPSIIRTMTEEELIEIVQTELNKQNLI